MSEFSSEGIKHLDENRKIRHAHTAHSVFNRR